MLGEAKGEGMMSSIIYWHCGWVFLSGAVAELRASRPGMMTLVALAISTAYVYSLAMTFGLVTGMPFYWELATLVTIMLLGHWMEMRAIGVNDAPALAQADVGIAIGAGTDVARASAGIVLVKNDPRDVARIIELSKASYRKMVQNLAWAVGYNVIALPLAAGALAPLNIVLPPAIGALLMSLSTVVVALNAQTLRGLQLHKEGGQ
jgi:cation transport ATPase